MIIIDSINQGTPEWLKLKAGKFSGSEIYKLCGAKGLGQTGESYIYDVAASEITGELDEMPETYAMQRGKEFEELARISFENVTDTKIQTAAAFVPEWAKDDCLVSPDGYFRVEKYFGTEFKCPLKQGIHLYFCTIKNAKDLKDTEPRYYWQILMSLLISDFDSWFFASFHPKFPTKMILHFAQIERNETDIKFLHERINIAIDSKRKLIQKFITDGRFEYKKQQ
jgi:hypothetical protein